MKLNNIESSVFYITEVKGNDVLSFFALNSFIFGVFLVTKSSHRAFPIVACSLEQMHIAGSFVHA